MNYEKFETRLGYQFCERKLLIEALTHPSYAHEQGAGQSNERLEFLGDAVLDLAIGHLLYLEQPHWNEGDLTRARSMMVNTTSLARYARQYDLGSVALLGRTEIRTGGHEKDSILANLFEAVIGAIYLDADFETVQQLISNVFSEQLSLGDAVRVRDPKTELQEWAHAEVGITPEYKVTLDNGVENSDQRFQIVVRISDRELGRGTGRSKKLAERAAAIYALASLK